MRIGKQSVLRSMILACAAAALGCLACSAAEGTSELGQSPAEHHEPGTLRFAIDIDGVILTEVHYDVANATTSISGTIDTSQPGSTISAAVAVPAGDAYVATLTATGTGAVLCSGASAPFDVTAADETEVFVDLRCTYPPGQREDERLVTINADAVLRSCPNITAYAVSPLQVGIGGDLTLTATASGPDATFTWSEQNGSVAAPDSANTSYRCEIAGPDVITLTVGSSTTLACRQSVEVAVNCSSPP